MLNIQINSSTPFQFLMYMYEWCRYESIWFSYVGRDIPPMKTRKQFIKEVAHASFRQLTLNRGEPLSLINLGHLLNWTIYAKYQLLRFLVFNQHWCCLIFSFQIFRWWRFHSHSFSQGGNLLFFMLIVEWFLQKFSLGNHLDNFFGERSAICF